MSEASKGLIKGMTKVMVIREAAKIERSHCIPKHGAYTNGFHQYNVTAMLLVLHPDPSQRLIRATMFHDVAERFTGDTPYTAKQSFPTLKAALVQAELAVEHILGLNETLSITEQQWLVALDMVEFLLWCSDQINLGNRNAENSFQNAYRAIKEREASYPKPVRDFLEEYWERSPARLTDYIEQLVQDELGRQEIEKTNGSE